MSEAAEPIGSNTELGRPVIEVEDLEINFQGRVGTIAAVMGKTGRDAKAVDGVTLTLHEGEVLALAGESGCGKTTTARAIMGLLKPDKGEIRFLGEPLPSSTKALRPYRRLVQMVARIRPAR